jgi:hypothetical protein
MVSNDNVTPKFVANVVQYSGDIESSGPITKELSVTNVEIVKDNWLYTVPTDYPTTR